MIRRTMFWLSVMSVIVSTATCYRPSVPAPPTTAPSPATELQASLQASGIPGEIEWDKVIKAARKEGVVRIYQHGGGLKREVLVKGGFQEKYGIPVEVLVGRGNELAAKIFSERRAGIYLADLFMSGPDTMLNQLIPNKALDPIQSAFMLPELVDPELFKKVWRMPEDVFIEPEHLFFIFSYYSSPKITINSELVKGEEIKALRDFLNPRWKGRISIQDPTISGGGGSWFGVTVEMIKDAENFMRELAKQEPFITRNTRLQVQWLAQGKQAIAIAADINVVPEFIKAGASIKYHEILEANYVTSGSSIIALVNRAPHPNVAKCLSINNRIIGYPGKDDIVHYNSII